MRAKPYTRGRWIDHEMIQENVYEGYLLRVFDLNDIPDGFRGLVLEINDHGNMTLWNHFKNGNNREIWSVV
jgi:hypothetical protein